MTSQFEIEEITCVDLSNDVYQLAVVLYPPEVINEKFMIKLRDCVVKLPENHPVKIWLKWVGKSKPLSKKEQEARAFLLEVINSSFNLITDLKFKNRIIEVLQTLPEETIPEQILKSYFYLMIGNVTRSDNILRQIIATPPRVNWERSGINPSYQHKLARDEIRQIFSKLSNHPADRRTFQLLMLYFKSFYNDENLLSIVNEYDVSEVDGNLGLKFIEGLGPSLVQSLKISRMSENRKYKSLRDFSKYPLSTQSYWIWPFVEIDALVSDLLMPELSRIEKEDQLWFIYLMENEKLSDLYSRKSGKSFLPGRRPFLKECLNDHRTFMMGLYKLIELGDINPELVKKTVEQITHE